MTTQARYLIVNGFLFLLGTVVVCCMGWMAYDIYQHYAGHVGAITSGESVKAEAPPTAAGFRLPPKRSRLIKDLNVGETVRTDVFFTEEGVACIYEDADTDRDSPYISLVTVVEKSILKNRYAVVISKSDIEYGKKRRVTGLACTTVEGTVEK